MGRKPHLLFNKKNGETWGKFQPLLHTHNQNLILGRFYTFMHFVTKKATKPRAIFV